VVDDDQRQRAREEPGGVAGGTGPEQVGQRAGGEPGEHEVGRVERDAVRILSAPDAAGQEHREGDCGDRERGARAAR
jgi:hypothetical protein